MASGRRGWRRRALATSIALGALVVVAPAAALTVDPQKLVDSAGVPHVPGAPAVPPVTVPDPPQPASLPPAPAALLAPSHTSAPSNGTGTPSTASPRSLGSAEGSGRTSGPEASTGSSQSRSVGGTPAGPAGIRPRAGAPATPARSPAPAAGPAGRAAHRTARVASGSAGSPLDLIGASLPLPAPLPDWSKPIIAVLLLLALAFGVRARMTARRARRLERQRAALARDVDAMQAALVPELPSRVGALEVSVAYRPAEGPAAGGDFYDVFSLDATRVAVIVGDVSGHGRAALARAAQARFTLRAYLELGMEPRTALALAGARPSADRDDFATVAVGIHDSATGVLTYATAGHPPPIVRGLRGFDPIAACASVPLGWGVPTGRRQTTVSLPAGATACFYTDGLAEARARGELLGRERVAEMLTGLGPAPQAASLLEGLRKIADEAPDDMAACLLRTTGGAAEPVRLEEIELDDRQLAAGRGERFLDACEVAPGTAATALRRAQAIAGEFGATVLCVRVDEAGRNVIAEPPLDRGGARLPSLVDAWAAEHPEERVPVVGD
jgi:Stage II sporulation protein E (SpoIIE)